MVLEAAKIEEKTGKATGTCGVSLLSFDTLSSATGPPLLLGVDTLSL